MSTIKFKPLQDRVLVKRLESESKSPGGIVIPDTAKEKPAEGEVVAIGPGKRLENGECCAVSLKAGDRILFSKYSGTDVKINGQEYIVMREDDILGIIG